jgi:hypothetical protein
MFCLVPLALHAAKSEHIFLGLPGSEFITAEPRICIRIKNTEILYISNYIARKIIARRIKCTNDQLMEAKIL